MKPAIHPKYKPLKLKIGDEIFMTNSTYPGDEFLIEINWKTHRAWNKNIQTGANESNKSVSKFNNKFSGLKFGINK